MPSLHVLTVTPGLPAWLLDHLLTTLEQTLCEAGATRVWISPDHPELSVMADLSPDVLESGTQP